jgi:hypothetical protein
MPRIRGIIRTEREQNPPAREGPVRAVLFYIVKAPLPRLRSGLCRPDPEERKMEEDGEKAEEEVVRYFDEEDVERGRFLVDLIAGNQYHLGELADSIEPKYGKGTLESFAEAIGIEYNTLKGYRTVWRKLKGASVRPHNYSLAKALVSLTTAEKEWYLENWPNETEKQAREDVRTWKKEEQEKNGENKGYELPNVKRLIKNIVDKTTRWEYELGLLLEHRQTLTGTEINELVRALEILGVAIYTYREQFKEPTER